LGRLAVEYLQGRRIAMAIEGIFEWSPDDEFTEHLNEAAEALLASLDDFGDEETSHTNRVIEYSIGIGKELDLPPGRLRVISLGALFHDVGTIAIPEEILNKPGALTEAERQLVRDHTERGWAMANRSQALWEAALAIRHHHEWVDGSGYPDGLAGDDIPIEARVIAVADMYDALLTPRPYREALTESEALTLMKAECGTHLDRDCYHAFVRHLQRHEDNVVPLVRETTHR
jgi:HD-GYP domain-containing protein (c-di-GMP phosphodiesterase class II)